MNESPFWLVIPVANQQSVRGVSRIQCHAVCCVELFQAISFGSKVREILSGFVKTEDMVARVSIRKVDITVLCNGDGCGDEFI